MIEKIYSQEVTVMSIEEALSRRVFSLEKIMSDIKRVRSKTWGFIDDSISDAERRRIFSIYPAHCQLLLIHSEIVGVWSFICLRPERFALIKQGKLLEKQIKFEDTVKPTSSDINWGYCFEVAILEEYRHHTLALLQTFIKQTEDYAVKGIFFPEWCTRACTKQGEHLSSILGLKKILSLENIGYRGGLYWGNAKSALDAPFIKKCYRLSDLYMKRFGNPNIETWKK